MEARTDSRVGTTRASSLRQGTKYVRSMSPGAREAPAFS